MSADERMKRMMVILNKYESRKKRSEIYGAARKVVQDRVVLLLKAGQMEQLREVRQ